MMRKRSPLPQRIRLIVVVALLGLPGVSSAQEGKAESVIPFLVLSAAAPEGAENLSVQWLKVSVPSRGEMLLAVAKPQGKGPFPTILLLHGSHGFAREYVQLAQGLAREGVLAVAACWFSGGTGAGVKFITPLGCPGAPAMPEASSEAAGKIIDALSHATSSLPNVQPAPVALFGHSRGGGAVLNYVLATGNASAAVLDSAGYPSELANRVAELKVPLLILHGAADSPKEGGSPMTNIQMARQFEAALRRAGKPVEAHYYESGHNGIFNKSGQADDSVRRIAAFVKRHAQR